MTLASVPAFSLPFALLALTGCPQDTDTSGTKETGGGTEDVLVEATAKETVFKVTWTTDFPADARLEYGIGETFDHQMSIASSDDGLTHTGLVFGLAESQTWTLRAVSDGTDGSSSWTSETFTIDVPAAPSDMPGYTMTVADTTGTLDGFYLVTNSLEGSPWVSILDNEGRRVWWTKGDDDAQISDVWYSADKGEIYFLDMGLTSSIHVTSIDGSRDEDLKVDGIHHTFFPLPDGGWATLQFDQRDWKGTQVIGDSLVEIAEDGSISRTVWATWDDLDPGPGIEDMGDGVDYCHANTVWLDDNTGDYVVSLRVQNSIVGVANDGSGMTFALGTGFPDFTLTEGDEFYTQHGVQMTENGFVVFNNRDYQDGEHDLWSEGVEFEVDWDAHTYRRVWSYDAGRIVFSPVLGNTQPLPNGDYMVAWGAAGRISRVTADGDVLFQMDGELGAPVGYSRWVSQIEGATR